MHLDVAALEYRSNLHRKGLPATVAFINPQPGGLAIQLAAFVLGLAVGADPAIGPDVALYELKSGGFVVEIRAG